MSQLQQSTRQNVLDNHDRSCVFCGVTEEQHRDEYDQSLDIHHILPRHAGGSDDPENLIPLCRSCHRTIERTQADAISRIKERLVKQEVNQSKIQEVEDERDEFAEKAREENRMSKRVLDGVESLAESKVYHTLYIVHEGQLGSSEILYCGGNVDEATEAFKKAEGISTLETQKLGIDEWVDGFSETVKENIGDNAPELADYLNEGVGRDVFPVYPESGVDE